MHGHNAGQPRTVAMLSGRLHMLLSLLHNIAIFAGWQQHIERYLVLKDETIHSGCHWLAHLVCADRYARLPQRQSAGDAKCACWHRRRCWAARGWGCPEAVWWALDLLVTFVHLQ